MHIQAPQSHRTACFLLTFLLYLVAAAGLNAIVVTTTQDENGDNPSACSLREAVTTLNGQTSFGGCVFTQGDTLVELAGDSYELSLDLGISDGLTLSVPMTLRGQGPQQTIIERVDPLDDGLLLVRLSEPGAVTLDGFTIRGVTGLFNNAVRFLSESGTELILRDLVFADNVAQGSPFDIQGEADGIARLERVVFENNRNLGETSGGGGLDCDTDEPGIPPSLFLKDVIFRGNVATEEIGGFGAFGGGMRSQGCNLTLENVTFDSNSAVGIENDSFGGALFLTDYTGTSTQVELTNVTFFNNTADLGGAILQFSAGNPLDTTLSQVTFAGNQASSGGDHIYQFSSLANLRNVVFGPSPNAACDGNPAPNFSLLGGNIDSDGSCGVEQTVADPGLASALGQRGGFTTTLPLLDGSAAIDAGTNTDCAAVDQRGAQRPFDGDGDGTATCDVGAFEYFGDFFFDSFESGDLSAWSASFP